MNIFEFVDSRDIRGHLRSIGYEFSTPEAAFLVATSNMATFDRKMRALEEIVETMPNCSLEGRLNMEPIADFHEFLRKYIELQKQVLAQFKQSEKCVYFFDWCRHRFSDDHSAFGPYSTYEACRAAGVASIREENEDAKDGGYERVCITKRWIDADEGINRDDTCYLNPDGEVLEFDCRLRNHDDWDVLGAFEGMWFDFPTPFHAGDIVCSLHKGEPFVLELISTWGESKIREELPCSEYRECWVKGRDKGVERLRCNGDISDMYCTGYSASTDVNDKEPLLWNDGFPACQYLDIEFYRNPLTGYNRVLKVVQRYLKRDCSIECLLNAYGTIAIQALSSKLVSSMRTQYLAEFIEKVGLAEGGQDEHES